MEDTRTFSESEDEAIQDAIGRLDESMWYNLRPEIVPRVHARHRSEMEVAVDSSDELDFYPDPRPLFAGGQKPHADRLEPQKTKKCDNATRAGTSRRATERAKDGAAGPGGDEFHNIMACLQSAKRG